jgi:hypothetical protein
LKFVTVVVVVVRGLVPLTLLVVVGPETVVLVVYSGDGIAEAQFVLVRPPKIVPVFVHVVKPETLLHAVDGAVEPVCTHAPVREGTVVVLETQVGFAAVRIAPTLTFEE